MANIASIQFATMSTDGKRSILWRVSKDAIVWAFDDVPYDCAILVTRCPACKAHAIVVLPAPVLAEQPDETTHVCHPAMGGCNAGYALT